MEITGNVVVKNESYRIKTENLTYDHKKRIVFTKVPVRIISDSFNFLADFMFFDLNTNKALLEGNVKGTFSENITF